MYEEFILAIKMNQPLLVKELIRDYDIDVHANRDEAFVYTSSMGYINIVKILLEAGANINDFGHEALKWASRNGHTDVVKLLIENGVDVNANNNEALKYAGMNGYIDVIKLLIDNGADVNAVPYLRNYYNENK